MRRFAASDAGPSTWPIGLRNATGFRRPPYGKRSQKTTTKTELNRPAGLAATPIATWFGCGYAPAAPGTVASAAAILIAYALVVYGGWKPLYFAALALAATPAAVWASGWVERQSGILDPRQVVVDEVVGQWLTIAGATALNWKSWIAAFVLFRLFDIWKPGPVGKIQSWHGGLGIVADDLLAGLLGALVLFAAGCFNLY